MVDSRVRETDAARTLPPRHNGYRGAARYARHDNTMLQAHVEATSTEVLQHSENVERFPCLGHTAQVQKKALREALMVPSLGASGGNHVGGCQPGDARLALSMQARIRSPLYGATLVRAPDLAPPDLRFVNPSLPSWRKGYQEMTTDIWDTV